MKRLILLMAMVMAMAILAPAAFADESDVETDDAAAVEKELSAAQMWKAEMIAAYFTEFLPLPEAGDEPTEESPDDIADDPLLADVLALRGVVGWGAVFKLMIYAETGGDPWLIGPLGDDGGFGFGKLLKDAEFEGDFTNLGQLQKSNRVMPDKPDKPEKAAAPGQVNKKDKAGR